jgi:hypothetical protein
MNLYHFYHVYADGRWQEPLQEHFDTLIRFGLINNLKSFNVGIVGNIDNRNIVKDFIRNYNLNINFCNETDDGWEQETLDSLYYHSKENDGLVLYTHTKTAVNYNDLHVRWRKSMEYYNVVRWSDCVNFLNNGHSGVGCYYIPIPSKLDESMDGYYAGTFWWTHCKYIRNFPKVARGNRYDAEGWIGFLKPSVEKNNEPFNQYDWTPTHPGDEIGRVISW